MSVPYEDIVEAKQLAMQFDDKIKSVDNLKMMAAADFLYAFTDDSKRHIHIRTRGNGKGGHAVTCFGEKDVMYANSFKFDDIMMCV